MYRIPGGIWLLGWTDPLHIARRLLRQAVQERAYYAQGWLLDLGCGGQPYRNLFNHVERYIGLDQPPNGQVDVYGDGMALPFRDGTFDTVLCNEVLEHVPEPSRLMAEAERVLRPGGYLLLTTPQTWGLHLEPCDFYRYTKYGLQYLVKKSKLEVVEVVPTCGLWATLAQRFADTIINTYFVGHSQWIVKILSLLLAPVLMIGYGLDKLFGKRGDTLDYMMVARKPNGS
jgi:SAM-dependent methyltransferase